MLFPGFSGIRWDLDNAESIMALGSLYYSELC